MTTRRPTAPPAADDDRLLRYEDVARMLNCSRRFVQQLVTDGELRAVRLRHGSALRLFRLSDVQAYIRDLPEAG